MRKENFFLIGSMILYGLAVALSIHWFYLANVTLKMGLEWL